MKNRIAMVLIAAIAVAACGSDHNAGIEHSEDDGHVHTAAESGTWAVTAWGEHFEVFPEIDELVTGETAGAHVHVTDLDGFTPLTEGSVTVVLSGTSGANERFSSSAVVRPGIFAVEITPGAPGERDLTFEIETEGVVERIHGGLVRVGTVAQPGSLMERPHALPPADGGEALDFLKEQQWRTSFATEWAEVGLLRPGVAGAARIEPPSGGRVVLTAPVDGVVRGSAWPFTGQRVAAGAEVLSMIPTAGNERSLADLEATVRELDARFGVAESRVERLEALLVKEAVSRREVEQAGAEATGIEARLEAARSELEAAEAGRVGRVGVAGLQIRAPFSGRVAEVLVSPGEQVDSGTALVRVIRERPVWVRVALTPDAAALLDDGIVGLTLDTGASSASVEIGSDEIRLVAVAPEVDARTGTVEALVEVSRSVDELRPGLRATAQILLPGDIEGMLLPLSAVVDDAGISVVYIQLDGESFLRREVSVGECRGSVAMVEGVLPGERVVTVGGASIRRASLMASGSVEGHVH